jgi:hypothetical protein
MDQICWDGDFRYYFTITEFYINMFLLIFNILLSRTLNHQGNFLKYLNISLEVKK